MKRFLIVFMVLGLITGSVAMAEAENASRVERTVKGKYGPGQLTGCMAETAALACMVVDARPTEAFFTAKVADAHGQPVFVEVINGSGRRVGTFCGKTTRPIPFEGSSLVFRIEPMPFFFSHWGLGWLGPLDCLYRIQTYGSISVTLSNLP